MNTALIARARKSYRNLNGVIVISPTLVADLADALEAQSASLEAQSASLEAQSAALGFAVYATDGVRTAMFSDEDHDGSPFATLAEAEQALVAEGGAEPGAEAFVVSVHRVDGDR